MSLKSELCMCRAENLAIAAGQNKETYLLRNIVTYFNVFYMSEYCQDQGHLSRPMSNLRDNPDIRSVMGWATTQHHHQKKKISSKMLFKVRSDDQVNVM